MIGSVVTPSFYVFLQLDVSITRLGEQTIQGLLEFKVISAVSKEVEIEANFVEEGANAVYVLVVRCLP